MSRAERPCGSQPGYPCRKTAILIITIRHLLSPRSFTRPPVGIPYGLLSVGGGEGRAYHVPQIRPDGLGLVSTPVAQRLRQRIHKPLRLATYLLVQAYQPVWLVLYYDAYNDSRLLTIPSTLALDCLPAGHHSLLSRFSCHCWSYVILRASHLAVAGDARLSRVLAAERKVISDYSRITIEFATSCRTMKIQRDGIITMDSGRHLRFGLGAAAKFARKERARLFHSCRLFDCLCR